VLYGITGGAESREQICFFKGHLDISFSEICPTEAVAGVVSQGKQIYP